MLAIKMGRHRQDEAVIAVRKKKKTLAKHLTIITIVFFLFLLCLNRMEDSVVLAQPFVTKGKIAFAHEEDLPVNPPLSNIYVIDADGTNLQQLTQSGSDSFPTWSPDGKQIMFSSGRLNPVNISQIYVMNADGTNQRPVNDAEKLDYAPDWAPDGQTIAFVTSRHPAIVGQAVRNTEIYLMNSDGSNQRRLTDNPPANDSLPTFSPDGKKIAFLSDRNSLGDYHLYVMNADGTRVVKLTSDPVYLRKPSWSPDGRWIAFTRFVLGWRNEIYRINADGTNPINLTNHLASDSNPSWSPDSKQIAFYSTRDISGIYLMNADGTGVVRLTPGGPWWASHGLAWHVPRNLAVTPHQKEITTWGWLKGRFQK